MYDPQSRQTTQDDYPPYNPQYQGGDNGAGRYSHDPRDPISRPSANPDDKLRKMNYAQELQDQIRQKQDQKYNHLRGEREKELDALKARLDNDPFGKQGSGAPLRDIFGNIITTKSKALHQIHDYPRNNNRAAQEPVFSLKARLARENLVSQSLDTLPRQAEYNAPNPYAMQQQAPEQGQNPFQMPFTYPFMPYQFPSPYGYPQPGMPPGYAPPSYNVPTIQDTAGSMHDVSHRGNRASQELDGYGGRGGGGGGSFALPQGGEPNDRVAKQKRVHTYQMYQDELLQQMEEKKRKKEAETMRKKMEDEMEDERVRRENAQMREQDQNEAMKTKKKFQDFQQENGSLMANNTMQNTGVVVLEAKKGNNKGGKRPRTPIEDLPPQMQAQMLLNQMSTMQSGMTTTDVGGIQYATNGEFPIEVGKRIQATIENQLSGVKKEWDDQQMELHAQLIELKRQLLNANRERVDAQQEIGDLKANLRSQYITEEIRRTELYGALLKGQALMQQPAVLPTITKLEDTETRPFEFPKGRGLYRREMDDGDVLDAMLAGQSKIIDPNAKIGTHGRLVERVNSRPVSSGMDDTEFGINYLNHFNQSDDRAGIRLDDRYGLDLPDELGLSKKMNFYDDGRDGVGEILRKNKERLDVLDDLEYKEFGGKDREYVKRTPGAIDDEIYQMLKSESVEDNLLDQINNPRRYQDIEL